MKQAILCVLVGFVGLVAAPPAASAHPLDIGYLRIRETEPAKLEIGLDIAVAAAATLLHVPVEQLGDAAVVARGPELAALTLEGAPITTAAGACRWRGAAARLDGGTVKITDTATCPGGGGARRWAFPFVKATAISATFELLIKETVGDGERVTLVDRYEPELALATSSAAPTGLPGFIWSGVKHIGVAPVEWRDAGGWKLPDGIDHILFLIALLLGGGTLLQLVGIATGFTLGHSITLALATLDVVRPPPSVIEPLIALSIALAAVEAMFGRFAKHRWKIATGFGLIHGFGFAAALVKLDLSTGDTAKALFGYNLGVELGQVTIVLAIAPLVILAHRSERLRHRLLPAIAALIFIAGMYWFVQRLAS